MDNWRCCPWIIGVTEDYPKVTLSAPAELRKFCQAVQKLAWGRMLTKWSNFLVCVIRTVWTPWFVGQMLMGTLSLIPWQSSAYYVCDFFQVIYMKFRICACVCVHACVCVCVLVYACAILHCYLAQTANAPNILQLLLRLHRKHRPRLTI